MKRPSNFVKIHNITWFLPSPLVSGINSQLQMAACALYSRVCGTTGLAIPTLSVHVKTHLSVDGIYLAGVTRVRRRLGLGCSFRVPAHSFSVTECSGRILPSLLDLQFDNDFVKSVFEIVKWKNQFGMFKTFETVFAGVLWFWISEFRGVSQFSKIHDARIADGFWLSFQPSRRCLSKSEGIDLTRHGR